MNFLNLTSFLKIRHVKLSKETEVFDRESTVTQVKAGLEFWKQQLSGELPVMEWPANPVHPHTKSDRETYTGVIPHELSEKIHAYFNNHNIDLSEFLLATLRIMLYRYSRQEDLIIGNVIHLEDTIGLKFSDKKTINALPLRIQINGRQSFQDVLMHTKQINVRANANKNISYKTLAEAVESQPDKSCPSIFQVLFHCKEVTPEILNQENIIADLAINNIPVPDLFLEISDQSGTLLCDVNYNAQVLNYGIIEQMMNHFQNLLEAVIEDDNLPVGMLSMLSPAELRQQLIEFNQPELKYQPGCAHHLFEQQANQTPDAIAVRFDDQYLTYKELNSKANQLAHRLQRYGIGPETIVGLCMHRSPQFLIGLLGILKAGGAFLPLDPSLPADRLSFMLEDAAPALIITQEGVVDSAIFAQYIPFIYLDRDWPWIAQESSSNIKTKVEAHNLMYVIYTSGSSGKPKGVLIEHASLTSFLKAYEQVIHIDAQDKVLQFVPVVFDPMVEDIFCAFYRGATLVLRTEDMADSAEIFFERCKEWGITLLNLPAAFWHLLVGELTSSFALQLPASIRVVKVGGERLLPEKVDAWKKRFGDFPRLLNAYGPTETTIAATMYDCIAFSDRLEIPIGHRLMNLKAYVLDNHLQPVPMGVSGELCIGGGALARGYLNRSELESQKFIADPFSTKSGARMYRTGDLVRYLPDGKLEYLSRLDDQVKIRGFRIELGEIESVLAQYEPIKQVAVVVREEAAGDKRIVAYIVPKSEKIEATILRHYLLERLPEYMIPAIFVSLEKLPLTFNGKVDRNALPAPSWSGRLNDNYRAPKSHQEKLLAVIWQKILHIDEVGIEDNFFEIGGYSLLASKLLTEIKQNFHLKIPLSWIFAHPTIREQARYLVMSPDPSLWDTLMTIRIGGTKPPLYLIHDGLGGVEYGFQLSQFLSKDRPIYGFQAVGLNGIDEPMKDVKNIATFYVSRLLAHQPDGVYHLGGFSGGANIAFEMAQQLKAIGKQVGMVTIFDSYPLRLNRFTYQRVGISFIIRSIANLLFSSGVPLQEKLKILFGGIPQIIKENWIRIKFRFKEKSIDLSKNPNEKIFRALRSSNDSYWFKYYDGPLLFIRAIENHARYLRNSHFGWGRYAKHVHVYDLPGDHLSIFNKKENAKAVANILEQQLAEFENQIKIT